MMRWFLFFLEVGVSSGFCIKLFLMLKLGWFDSKRKRSVG